MKIQGLESTAVAGVTSKVKKMVNISNIGTIVKETVIIQNE